MKFDWQYRYVENGTKPDKQGRWALDLFILVKVEKNLPDYKKLNGTYGKYMPVRIATILQKKNVKFRFSSEMLSMCDENGDFLSRKKFKSNDLEEMKKEMEKEFTNLKNFFKNFR